MGRRRGSLQDKIFELVLFTWGQSVAVGWLWHPEVNFSESHQIAYLSSERSIYAQKKIRQYSWSVDDSLTLRASQNKIFRRLPNCIFGSKNTKFIPKKFGHLSRSATLICLRLPMKDFLEFHKIEYFA